MTDGEGCIGFKKNRTAYGPNWTFTNTDNRLIEKVISVVKPFYLARCPSRSENSRHKDCERLSMSGRDDLRAFLSLIKPHLIAKKAQAELVLEFIALRDAKWFGHPITPDELEIARKVQELNHKGK